MASIQIRIHVRVHIGSGQQFLLFHDKFFSLVFAQQNGLLEQFGVQFDRARRVVVGRHRIGDQSRIAVRIDDGHRRRQIFGGRSNDCVLFEIIAHRLEHDHQIGQTNRILKELLRTQNGFVSERTTLRVLAAFNRRFLDYVGSLERREGES